MSKKVYILVGPQGAGKSFLAKAMSVNGSLTVSQDEHGKDWTAVLKDAMKRNHEKIVVDRTNRTRKERSGIIEVAKAHGYEPVIMTLHRRYEECFQALMSRGEHPTLPSPSHGGSQEVIEKALSMFFSQYQYPTDEECVVTQLSEYDSFLLDLDRAGFRGPWMVIGDPHGCADELEQMIELGRRAGVMTFIISGDLFDRGPEIARCVEVAMNRPDVVCVMGNHDNKVLRYLRGNSVSITDGLQETISQLGIEDRRTEHAQAVRRWIESFPYVATFGGGQNAVVHAGINPRLPLARQDRDLITHVRKINDAGNMAEPGDTAWWWWQRAPWLTSPDAHARIFFGHSIRDEFELGPTTFSLDGGCVFGGHLRAAIVDPSTDPQVRKLTVGAARTYFGVPVAGGTEVDGYEEQVGEGNLRSNRLGTLVQYAYTEAAVHGSVWNHWTRTGRGIIFDSVTGSLVAKPMEKFFNLGEQWEAQPENLPDEPYVVLEKCDGSLGVIYHHDGRWNAATRGNLASEQAARAKVMLGRYDLARISADLTLCVEIVYPENRIVCDYGTTEELVLIAATNRVTRLELPWEQVRSIAEAVGMRSVREHDLTIAEAVEACKTLSEDEEGYVVLFEGGRRVKLKGHSYLMAHRFRFNTTPLRMWEVMSGGLVDREKYGKVGPGIKAMLDADADALEDAYSRVMLEITHDWVLACTYLRDGWEKTGLGKLEVKPEDMKKLGLLVSSGNHQFRHPKIIFASVRGKSVDEYVMKVIRPKNNVAPE